MRIRSRRKVDLDKGFGNIDAADGTVFGAVALAKFSVLLLGGTCIEPAGSDNGVGQPAAAEQSFTAAFPSEQFDGVIMGDANGAHEDDGNGLFAQRLQERGDGPIVDAFVFARIMGCAMGENDSIDMIECVGNGCGVHEITTGNVDSVRAGVGGGEHSFGLK